jgi:hypothetical protein
VLIGPLRVLIEAVRLFFLLSFPPYCKIWEIVEESRVLHSILISALNSFLYIFYKNSGPGGYSALCKRPHAPTAFFRSEAPKKVTFLI